VALCLRNIDPHLNCPDVCRSKTAEFCAKAAHATGACSSYLDDSIRAVVPDVNSNLTHLSVQLSEFHRQVPTQRRIPLMFFSYNNRTERVIEMQKMAARTAYCPCRMYYRQEKYDVKQFWKCRGVPALKSQRVMFLEEAAETYYSTLMGGRFIEDRQLDLEVPPASIIGSLAYLEVLDIVINWNEDWFGNQLYMAMNCHLFNNQNWVRDVFNRPLSRNTATVRAILDILYRVQPPIVKPSDLIAEWVSPTTQAISLHPLVRLVNTDSVVVTNMKKHTSFIESRVYEVALSIEWHAYTTITVKMISRFTRPNRSHYAIKLSQFGHV
ncbi:hypothetical protein AHF37_10894, partial [Paragonimus kellicotti]